MKKYNCKNNRKRWAPVVRNIDTGSPGKKICALHHPMRQENAWSHGNHQIGSGKWQYEIHKDQGIGRSRNHQNRRCEKTTQYNEIVSDKQRTGSGKPPWKDDRCIQRTMKRMWWSEKGLCSHRISWWIYLSNIRRYDPCEHNLILPISEDLRLSQPP